MKHPGIFCVWAALHITAFDAVGFATFSRDVFSTAVVIWRKGIFRIGSPNCFALVKFLLADGQPVGGLCFFAGASFLFIPGFAGPGTDFGRAVGVIRTTGVTRTRPDNRRSVPAIVSITGLALGRTIAPIGLAAVRTVCRSPVSAVVVVFSFAFAGTVGPVFGAAVRPFVNSGRTNAVGILSAAAVPGYRTRIRTVGRSILIFRLADAGLIFSAAFGAGTVLFGRTGNQSGVAFAGSVHFVAAFADTDLSGGTAYQIRHALASKPVGGVIGTNAVNRLHGIAVLFGKSLRSYTGLRYRFYNRRLYQNRHWGRSRRRRGNRRRRFYRLCRVVQTERRASVRACMCVYVQESRRQ